MKKIEALIQSSEKTIIYGAGNYAVILYTYLQLKKVENKIESFVVTNITNEKEEMFNKPVKQITDCGLELSQYLIIIAMASSRAEKVENVIKQKGMFNYVKISNEQLIDISNFIWNQYKDYLIDRNKLVIECYAGMGYRCNCKYIAQKLLSSNENIEIVWAVTDIDDNMPNRIKQVKRYSKDFFEELYTSGIYIGNDGHSPYIKKRKEQYYINTWHGSGPFKKVNASLFEGNEAKQKEYEEQFSIVDLFVSNTGDNTQMFRESFCYHGEIYECGSPRNDIFFQENNLREDLCKQLEIECDKKIVLYAPTFRDGDERSFESYDLDMQRVLSALEERFCSEFVLLYRFHHRLHKYEKGRNFYPDAINVTLYPDIQELLVASDVLITDYSSTMWDFSLQDRPIFLYHNDEAEYENDRGFYCPVRKWPYIKAHTTEEMIDVILKFDEGKYLEEIHAFINEYKSYDDGHASERVVERITDVINHPEKYGKE